MSKHSTQDKEIWKDIPSYEGAYQASTWGRIKALARTIIRRDGKPYPAKECMITLNKGTHYLMVSLHKNGTQKSRAVHQLILETFVGPRPEGMQCRHLNGRPHDNHLENLCWGTSKEQGEDRIRHGTTHRGERHHLTKLNVETVQRIRELRATGRYQLKDLAEMFGLHFASIASIVNGKTWKQAGGPICDAVDLRAKLTSKDVEVIKYLHNSGRCSTSDLATIFGVTSARINQVLKKR